MYRVGDYVYFETSSSAPYSIRRIEELIKTPSGNVDAKVVCFFRRRDIPSSLISLADKHQSALEEEQGRDAENLTEKQRQQLKNRELFLSRQTEVLPATQIRGKCSVTLLDEMDTLSSYLLQEDAFFYSLVYDPEQKTLLADRGEIRVGSRFQAEVPSKPLDDPETTDTRDLEKLEILEYTPENPLSDVEIDQFLTVVKSIGTFARALDNAGSVKQPSVHMCASAASRDVTLAHAMKTLHECDYDIGKAVLFLVPQTGPVLCRDEMEDWSASEGNLFEEALEKYGKHFFDIQQDVLPWKSMRSIVEYYYMWKTTDRHVQQKRIKATEADSKLKQVYIPTYTSGIKAGQPGQPGGLLVNGGHHPLVETPAPNGRGCEACSRQSSTQWHGWGSHSHSRLCQNCWSYWKKFGGLKYSSKVEFSATSDRVSSSPSVPLTGLSNGAIANPAATSLLVSAVDGEVYPCRECGKVFNRQERFMAHMAAHRPQRCNVNGCGKEFKLKAHLIRHCAQSHGLILRSGSPRPIMKTRAAFYLHTNLASKIARRVCGHLFRPRHSARKPFQPINAAAIKQECAARFADDRVPSLPDMKTVKRGTVVDVSHRLGTPLQECPSWLIATPKDELAQPERLAFTPPARGEDGQFIIPRPAKVEEMDIDDVPNHPSRHLLNSSLSPLMKKRSNEQTNGIDGPSSKRRQLAPTGLLNAKSHELYGISGLAKSGMVMNGKPKVATITRIAGRKQMISWVDAPDDVFFIATEATRRIRKQLPANELRKGARRPWRRVGGRHSLSLNNNNTSTSNNNSLHNNGSTNGNSGLRGMDLGQLV